MSILWSLLVLMAVPLSAQDVASQQARIRAAMRTSLAKQRASLALQHQLGRTPRFTSLTPIATPRPRPANFLCDPLAAPELTQLIGSAARQHNLDPSIVREVARQESAFHPCAVSSKGAQGLMQLMPTTQALLDVSNPFDPQESIEAGARLLKQLLLRYNGNLALALSAYNAGTARVDRNLTIPAIPETQSYVANILTRLSSPTPSSKPLP